MRSEWLYATPCFHWDAVNLGVFISLYRALIAILKKQKSLSAYLHVPLLTNIKSKSIKLKKLGAPMLKIEVLRFYIFLARSLLI